MKKVLLGLVCAVALVIGVTAQAQAYLIFSGIYDETVVSTTTPTVENRDCYKTGATQFTCETERTSTHHNPQRVFADRIYTHQNYSGRYIGSVDDTWVCYSHGRIGINVQYGCFNPVPNFP